MLLCVYTVLLLGFPMFTHAVFLFQLGVREILIYDIQNLIFLILSQFFNFFPRLFFQFFNFFPRPLYAQSKRKCGVDICVRRQKSPFIEKI